MTSRHVLFLFLDGVGLGENDPARNPFCEARMPALAELLGDYWFLSQRERIANRVASLVPTDACMGLAGRPQSATGQAALLTGQNVPAQLGEHYGPKPTPEIAALLKNGNLFASVLAAGGSAIFVNPYPPTFFEGIASGRRLLSAIPLAAQSAGLRLRTHEDLMAGQAISPDFSGEGWRERLGYPDTPVLGLREAGRQLARLAQGYSLAFFEHWPTDLAGHRRDFAWAVEMLERFDSVLAGLLEVWDQETGLILITSDHGNVEDLATRSHTLNPVPTIIIGRGHAQVASEVKDLTDIAPAVFHYLYPQP
jgi:hypothetical protein